VVPGDLLKAVDRVATVALRGGNSIIEGEGVPTSAWVRGAKPLASHPSVELLSLRLRKSTLAFARASR
jgi:hypothetical protein